MSKRSGDIKVFMIAVGAQIAASTILVIINAFFNLSETVTVLLIIFCGVLIIGIIIGHFILKPRKVSRIYNKTEHDIDKRLNDIKVSRVKQRLVLTLNPCLVEIKPGEKEPGIEVLGVHEYTLKNISDEKQNYSINYSVELGIQGKNDTGKLSKAIINGNEYNEEQIKEYVTFVDADEAMVYFKFDIEENFLEPNDKISFKFYTYGVYRPADHLIWTFQEFCEKDSQVEIINKVDGDATSPSPLFLRVNQHSGDYKERKSTNGAKRTIEFKHSILPFGGFVASWDFPKDVVLKKYEERLASRTS
jgi:hypothetical protein